MLSPYPKTCRLCATLLTLFVLLWQATTLRAQTIKHVPAHRINATGHVQDLIIIAFPIQGWYLLSLPVTPSDNTVTKLFPMAVGGVAYAWENNQYAGKTTVETGKGYWVAIPGPSAAFINGTPVTSFSGHYTQGWQLLGSVLGTVDFTNPNDTPDGAILLPIFRWNGDEQRYYPTVTSIEQSYGHWVAVMQECDLVVAGGSASAKFSKSATPLTAAAFHERFGATPPPPPPFPLALSTTSRLPNSTRLLENFPNPFNPATVIQYNLEQTGTTQLSVYNSLGQRIKTLVEAEQTSGIHQVIWNGRDDAGQRVVSGIYFAKLIAPNFTRSRKMIFLE